MSFDFFERELRTRTPQSFAMYQEAKRVLPGGVSAYGQFMRPSPLYFRDAQGARVTDIDGNEYVDLLMGYGIHILGHAPAVVTEAVKDYLHCGLMPSLATELQVRLAHKVQQHIPGVEMVRFVNSGTEATLTAIRVARAFRGRSKIAKFEGNYDGQHDMVLVSTFASCGSNQAPETLPDCAGISASTLHDLLILPYNDTEHAVSLINEHADELAGVILEPVSAFGLGCVPAEPQFIHAIREVTARHEIPLIFDEVVTNFRLGLGGASEYYGVIPDLVCLGKIVGGGFPIGGYGGRYDLMDLVTPPDLSGKVYQSGTFSGNVMSMAAGLAVIGELESQDVYQYIDKLGEDMRSGLREIADDLGIDMIITGIKSFFQVHFGVDGIRNMRDKLMADRVRASQFSQGLIVQGVLATPHPLFLSAAHTPGDVNMVLEAAETVLRSMRMHPAGA